MFGCKFVGARLPAIAVCQALMHFRTDAFASKLAPTGFAAAAGFGLNPNPLWERACSRRA